MLELEGAIEMNLSKQIKKYRHRDELSQEQLAEKLYVSRQTISNWENEKSYPDIHNLLLMSVLFKVSLDELVKGDVEIMKHELQNKQMDKWTISTIVGMLLGILSIGIVSRYLGAPGYILSFLFIGYGIYSSYRIDKIKKQHHLKTYQDIIAFQEGRQLTDIEKEKANKKHKWQMPLIVVLSGVISFTLAYLSMKLFS